jgi:hypothetical protein
MLISEFWCIWMSPNRGFPSTFAVSVGRGEIGESSLSEIHWAVIQTYRAFIKRRRSTDQIAGPSEFQIHCASNRRRPASVATS